MSLTITPQPVPLTTTEHGDICVVGTRISLETMIEDYNKGASPEDLVLNYASLNLADVHAVFAYYLRNKEAVDTYIKEQKHRAKEVRESLGIDQSSQELRATLRARWANKQPPIPFNVYKKA
jgi:uncharacterized protein (DUF433 family)